MSDKFDYRALTLTLEPCALCSGYDFEPLAVCDRHGFGLATVGCRRCGLVQTNPRPAESALNDFYRDHYRAFYQRVEQPDAGYVAGFGKETRLRYTAASLAEMLGPMGPATLLDFGCGEGSLFAAMRTHGFSGRFFGIEPNAEFAAYARRDGAAVFGSLEEVLASGLRFEVIVLNHVLEHFANPKAMLATIESLVSPSGALYVDVPDAERYRSVDELHIAHLLHFDLRTLRAILRSAGFREQVIETHEPPHHPASIRVLARKAASDESLPDAVSAEPAWTAVRNVQSRAWMSTMKRRLARIPGVSEVWRARRWVLGNSLRRVRDRR